MKRLIITFLFLSTLTISVTALAKSRTEQVFCPSGETVTQATDGNKVLVGCSGGTDIADTGFDAVTVNASCPGEQSVLMTKTSTSPVKKQFACIDPSATPTVDIQQAASGTGSTCNGGTICTGQSEAAPHQCGSGASAVHVSINFGCKGEACVSNPADAYCQKDHNAIVDVVFAIIRFLSIGVGIVIVASLVVAGIQFTSSRGDPNATAKAMERIRNTVIALLLFIFTYAILNFVIPNGFFK